MVRRTIYYVLVIFVLAAGSICRAQTSQSTLNGFLTDTSGAFVPHATVVVTNEQTNAVQKAVSDSTGFYLVPALTSGQYAVSSTVNGFKVFRHTGIILRDNQQLRVDVVLEVGNVSQSVSVTGAAVEVNTRTATLAQVVDNTRIMELPLNGRNVNDLITLQAGVVQTCISCVTSYRSENLQVHNISGSGYNVSGGRSNTVNFMIDGASNVDYYTTVSSATPNPDAVQEFSMQTSSYGAEFGHSGGVVNLVTRSGTNSLHGSAYDYVRNKVLNARNFFAAKQDTLVRNQFGFSVGGPVVLPKIYDGKDKTFFYFNYQGLRTNSSSGSGSTWTPTAALRNGDLSSVSKPVIDPTTGLQFQGNQIPAGRLDPALVKLMAAEIPLPGSDGLYHYTTAPGKTSTNEFNLRGDQNISNKNKVFVSFFRSKQFGGSQGTPKNVFDFGGGSGYTAKHLTVGDTHIFSPTLINSFSFGYMYMTQGYLAGTQKFNWKDWGVNGVQSLGGSAGHGGFYGPQLNFQQPLEEYIEGTVSNWNDALTWVRGPHELKFGGEAVHNEQFGNSLWRSGGRFIFGTSYTGTAEGDLLLGLPYYFAQTAPQTNDDFRTIFSLYAQDTYKIRRRLSLSYGLRYEPATNYTELRNRGDVWRPGAQSSVYPLLPPGLLAIGDAGVPRTLIPSQYGRLSPRFGFAFDPKGDGRWAVRGAFGIFKEQGFQGEWGGEQNAGTPFVVDTVITPPKSMSDPYNGHVNPFGSNANGPFTTSPTTPIPWPVGSQNVFAPGFQNAYIQQWNLTVEHQLAGKLLARASYVGSKGTRLPQAAELNPAVYIPGTNASGNPLSTTANTQSRRLYPNFTNVGGFFSDGNSIYHGLQLTLQRPISNRLMFTANYTFGKAIDDSNEVLVGDSSSNKVRAPFNHRIDRGRAQFDRRNNFVLSFVGHPWNPTTGNLFLRTVAGNWVLTSILTAQSGYPLTPLTGSDRSLQGPSFTTDHPDVVGDPNAPTGVADRRLKWFNTAAFAQNALGTYGQAGRDIINAPGYFDLDSGIYKNFPFTHATETRYLQFRAEFFNFLNHTNFGAPNMTVSSSNFGKITSAGAPRIIQFSLRVNF